MREHALGSCKAHLAEAEGISIRNSNGYCGIAMLECVFGFLLRSLTIICSTFCTIQLYNFVQHYLIYV